MAFKYTEEQYDKDKKRMTMEIRYDSEGNPTDSHGNPIGGLRPIPPHDVNAIPQITYLGKNKKRKT